MPTPQHHFLRLADVFSTTSEKISATLAAGALTTPLWRQYLKGISDDAALIAPILGCAWLCIQILSKLIEMRKLRRR